MQVIKIHRVIKNDRIAEIKQFIGKKVEIIILPEDSEEDYRASKENPLIKLRGSCPHIMDGMEFQNKIRLEWER